MRENSMEDLGNMNNVNIHNVDNLNGSVGSTANRPPVLDDNGKPLLRVQRTQLRNLQPAGGKKNQSSTNVDQPYGQITLAHIESMEEDLEKMSSQQLVDSAASQADYLGAEGLKKAIVTAAQVVVKKKKRGHTHKHLTMEEEMKYMIYTMITDLFDFEELKQKKDFAIKRYKESLYRGELVSGHRHGQGICVYEIGRVYEGEWVDDKRHGKGYELFSNKN